LFQLFLGQACKRFNTSPPLLTQDSLKNLLTRSWPGNIRELKNEAERFAMGLDFALPSSSTPSSESPLGENGSLVNQVNSFEKTLIEQELIRQKGDIKKTHTALGLPRQTLYDKMQKYGLKRSDFI